MKYAIAAIALIASTPAHAGTYAETVQRTDVKKSASKVKDQLCID